MAKAIPDFEPFIVYGNDTSSSSIATRWKKWLQRFNNLMVAMDISAKKRKRALLIHLAGSQVYDIFDTFTAEQKGSEDDFDTAVKSLTTYFEPKKNTEYEIYKFRQASQRHDEKLDSYHTRLRHLASTCEFADMDREIKTQIVQTCTSQQLRRKALRTEMTLQQLLDQGRAYELSHQQAQEMENNNTESVNQMKTAATRNYFSKNFNSQRQGPRQESTKLCYFCSKPYPHPGVCPAKGKTCRLCGKLNHFAVACRSSPQKQQHRHHESDKRQTVKYVNEENASDNTSEHSESDEYTFMVQDTDENTKHPMANLRIQNLAKVKFIIDTGATVNLLEEKDFEALKPEITLQHSSINIYPYKSDKPLRVLGKFTATVESRKRIDAAEFFVVSNNGCLGGSLLSYNTAKHLGLIAITNAVDTAKNTTVSCNVAIPEELFNGVGKLKDHKVKLHIDESIPPVAQTHRRIPFHLRKQVEKKLEEMEKDDIIEKTEGPTPWVSPIVVPKPKSPNDVRICVDMRAVNKAIQRERHITPTIDDVIADLNDAKVFSKLDLNQGYHQLELSEESRYITTFSTHVGLRRYKRLNFEVTSAAEIFQNTIRETLEGLNGCINISDDILVYGSNQKEHDNNLKSVLERLQSRNLTLNKLKCEFNKTSVEYFGYVFSSQGISPDPRKLYTQLPTSIQSKRSPKFSRYGQLLCPIHPKPCDTS
ncbi:Hypothetical predicted protein [Paramuricea clavata]|uniref:Uncharacterized protein n=1 Tax=Paramuricea clavata TaxID=317549 RepID=A0A7D9JVQ7_PARCT|nr:Hypothetical predicted protein [Paramuricea clavata]